MLTRVKGWLTDRRVPLLVALLAILLLLPTLGAGAFMDDHVHRMAYHPTFTQPGGPAATGIFSASLETILAR
ncbi:hypothetical protein KEG38_49145 [Polyangium jinanense]|uniref:hypothetical protein n=1 Tax=Polyangium jinanense TaxID=2829994 RepID=UPI002340DBAF|nr:hypothetical protein [Polyangium jinanense]MDC3954767.1 hypothetical protein [Polyangium jinanense]MDC3961884.1 hypothetical protein [Polyangium jinanense]